MDSSAFAAAAGHRGTEVEESAPVGIRHSGNCCRHLSKGSASVLVAGYFCMSTF